MSSLSLPTAWKTRKSSSSAFDVCFSRSRFFSLTSFVIAALAWKKVPEVHRLTAVREPLDARARQTRDAEIHDANAKPFEIGHEFLFDARLLLPHRGFDDFECT